MLEKFKKSNLDQKKVDHVKLVNRYWLKDINKSIKILNKWAQKFNDFTPNFLLSTITNDSDYVLHYKEFSSFNDFFIKKYKAIVVEFAAYKKFSKIMYAYAYILVHYDFLRIIDVYYTKLESVEDLPNKRIIIIEQINSVIKTNFDLIKKEYDTILKDDEFYKLNINKIEIYDKQIFDPTIYCKKINAYLCQLFRKKQISKNQLDKISIMSFELFIIIDIYCRMSHGFLISIY